MKVQPVGFNKVGLTVVGLSYVGTPCGEPIEGGSSPVGSGRYITKDGRAYRLKNGMYYNVNAK